MDGMIVLPNKITKEMLRTATGNNRRYSIDEANGVMAISEPISPGVSSIARGSIHMYRLDGDVWMRTATLADPDRGHNNQFGHTAWVNKDTLITSAISAKVNGVNGQGKVFVYRYVAPIWRISAVISPTRINSMSGFGSCVSAAHDASLIAVGAPTAMMCKPHQGYVSIYDKTLEGWRHKADLTCVPQSGHARYGLVTAVSPEGDHIACGYIKSRIGVIPTHIDIYTMEDVPALRQTIDITSKVPPSTTGISLEFEDSCSLIITMTEREGCVTLNTCVYVLVDNELWVCLDY